MCNSSHYDKHDHLLTKSVLKMPSEPAWPTTSPKSVLRNSKARPFEKVTKCSNRMYAA